MGLIVFVFTSRLSPHPSHLTVFPDIQSQPSPRATLHCSRNGSATSLARISSAFRSRSRSRNTSTGSGSSSGSGSGVRFRASVSHPGLPSSSFLDICQVLPLPQAPCAWAIRLTWTGVRERWATRKAIRSACPSLAVRAACCRGTPGCVYVRLRATRDGHPFQFRRPCGDCSGCSGCYVCACEIG